MIRRPITRDRRRARAAVRALLAGLASRHRELAAIDGQCGALDRAAAHAAAALVLDELAAGVGRG